jgi:hypothetical protein
MRVRERKREREREKVRAKERERENDREENKGQPESAHCERWMMSGQTTVFHWVSVP